MTITATEIRPYKASWTDEQGKALYADSARLGKRGTGWVEFSWLPELNEVHFRFISEPDYPNYDYLLHMLPEDGTVSVYRSVLISKKRSVDTIPKARGIWNSLICDGWSTQY